MYHGWCSQCGTWREAPLDVSREVVGQGRFGVKIASLMSYLRTVMRLPVRQIQAYLASLHGLSISSGEIIGLAQRVTAQLEPQLAEVQQQIRASPAVQMDAHGVARRWEQWLCVVCLYAAAALLRVSSLARQRGGQSDARRKLRGGLGL